MLHLQRLAALCAGLAALATAGPLANGNADHTQRELSSSDKPSTKLPSVWPPPQQISAVAGCSVRLNRDVTIVAGQDADEPTLQAIKDIVAAAGGAATVSPSSTGKGAQIIVGTGADAAAAAKALTGDSAAGLAAEGYVLGAGKYNKQATVVLNGVDARGTYYAAQTLRQLVAGSPVAPGVKVRDWPLMPIRGSIEGFYGIPWSHQARLDQFVFYGKHKMNTYVYTPKSDPLLRATWRKLYTGDQVNQLKELIQTADANHVDFTYALSPGLDLCYSSDADFNATVAKFEQLRNLGVSSFYVALDDIPLQFHCDSDEKKWPKTTPWNWLADAQTFYLNRVQEEYLKVHGLRDLETVPTNYAGSKPDPYKGEFGKQLNKNISIQWTGEGVFSGEVTVDSVVAADSTYVTDKLFIWDNFPVNDNKPFRLFLNPLTGRAADLYKHLIGFTSNPMVQAYASMIALGNYGDYSWNGPAYEPAASWTAVIEELAGGDEGVRKALFAFVDLNQNWPYRNATVEAPQWSKDMDAFWAARDSGNKAGEKPFLDRLELVASLDTVLPKMAMKPWATEVKPWSTVAVQWATAAQHAIAMLDAKDVGDKDKAKQEYDAAQEWVQKTKAKTLDSIDDSGAHVLLTPTTGDGVPDAFVSNCFDKYNH